MLLINQLISACLQLGLVICLTLFWYLLSHHKFRDYLTWLGLRQAGTVPWNPILVIFLTYFIVGSLPYSWLYHTGKMVLSDSRSQSFDQQGWSWQFILLVFIWSVFQTALSEEIFFRGFLGKRLMAKFGFRLGNSIQALSFASLHILALVKESILAALLIFILTAAIAYALGWLMAKKAEGSILYGWLIHSLINLCSSFLIFALFL